MIIVIVMMMIIITRGQKIFLHLVTEMDLIHTIAKLELFLCQQSEIVQ